MARGLSSNIFTGIIDTDSDEHLVAREDYRDALNIHNGYGAFPGAAENIKGTQNVFFSLPSGINSCIGAFENKQRNTLIYFIANDLGNHRILRYSVETGNIDVIAALPQGALNANNLIHSASFIDGKILVWTDGWSDRNNNHQGNPPRKINIDKAANLGKMFTYELIAGVPGENQFTPGAVYTFRIQDVNGSNIAGPYTFTSDGTYQDDPAGGLAWLMDSLSQLVDAKQGTRMQYDICDCKATIYMGITNERLTVTSSKNPDDVILIPLNHYGRIIREQHYDLAKRPPTNPPVPVYVSDPNVGYNNVAELCAQFRTRYIYDDGEKSAWGPISHVALNVDLNGSIMYGLNAIEVDFSETLLTDPDWLTLIREVEVAWRDGNDGEFLLIKRIPVCEIGILKQKVLFYNDQLYQSVESDEGSSDDTQVLKNFDWLPLISSGVETSSDEKGRTRLFLAGNTEGYDCPDCVEMTITTEEFTDVNLITIKGTVDIINHPDFPSDYPSWYPPSSDLKSIGGLVVYLAGTDYYAVSDNPDNTNPATGYFEIKGVPRGTYILRVASPYCRFDDLNGSRHNLKNGKEWQRSSAPTIDVAGSVAFDGKKYERILDLTAVTTEFDLDTEPGYGPIQVRNMHAFRWIGTNPISGNTIFFLSGYVVDAGGGDTPDSRKAAINVELQTVSALFNSAGVQNVVCDHNGYFFYNPYKASADTLLAYLTHSDFDTIKVYLQNSPDKSSLVYKGLDDTTALVPWSTTPISPGSFFPPPVNTTPVGEVLLINTSEQWSLDNRAQVNFQIVDDNTNPLSGVLCQIPGTSGGRFEFTSQLGLAIITVYANTGGQTRIISPLLTYPSDYSYQYAFTQPSSQTINTAVNLGPTVVAALIPAPGGVSIDFRFLKLGGVYRFCVIYKDDIGRTCGASFGSEFRMPFPTTSEKLYPKSVFWEIDSIPPDWATHYFIGITKEAYYQRYIQWMTDQVTYMRITDVDAAPVSTSYAAGDATHIFIKVNRPLDENATVDAVLFFQRNSEQSGYEPQTGDRVRFVVNESGFGLTPDGSIIELPVVGRYVSGIDYYVVVEAIEIGVEIKPEWVIEFISPNKASNEIFYEISPRYEIIDPGEPERAHAGPLQDQSVDLIVGSSYQSVSPAKGKVVWGDTYWRYETWSTVGSGGRRAYTEHTTIAVNRLNGCADLGRAFVENKDFGKRFYYNRIRFSDLFLPDTKINGTSSFMALDYNDINRAWGAIKKIAFVHNVLLAWCRFKLQPVYIGKGRLQDLSGNYNVGRSDSILNIADETVVDAGCEHPESIVVQDGYAYWWDAYNGIPWRYARNGVNPINAKTVKTWRAYGKERLTLANAAPSVGGFDRQLGQYVLTLGGFGEVGTVTWGFDELKNGWSTRYSFTPEAYGEIGQYLISFKDGQLYIHNTNGTRNNFYGVQYQSQIRFVANPDPRLMKIFWATRVVSNRAVTYPDIVIPAAYPDYINGMRSRLRAERWESYEGAWNADFMRDMYDSAAEFVAISNSIANAARQKAALLRGRNLRGEVMVITMETVNGSADYRLLSADVYFSPSQSSHP